MTKAVDMTTGISKHFSIETRTHHTPDGNTTEQWLLHYRGKLIGKGTISQIRRLMDDEEQYWQVRVYSKAQRIRKLRKHRLHRHIMKTASIAVIL